MDYGLTPELNQIIDYLSNVFSKSINSPVHQKADLAQDLIVLYLERQQGKDLIEIRESKDYWFRIFKNYLISKYRSIISEKKLLAKIEKEEIFNRNSKTDTKIFDL